jgi:Flp pilus assembly pilin Flp
VDGQRELQSPFTGHFNMNIATKIINFIKDERGAEVTEFAVVTLVVATGAAASIKRTSNSISDKNDDMIAAINVDPT